MRGVDKGNVHASEGEVAFAFLRYSDAKPYLEKRIGRYCSYCERFIPVSLAVEHKLPKSIHPDLEWRWENFLLACANCNSAKKDKNVGDIFSM
jgi:5-methylcytosine-specific restriction endonuclease McrA